MRQVFTAMSENGKLDCWAFTQVSKVIEGKLAPSASLSASPSASLSASLPHCLPRHPLACAYLVATTTKVASLSHTGDPSGRAESKWSGTDSWGETFAALCDGSKNYVESDRFEKFWATR